MASGATKTEAKRGLNLKKKKEAHIASGATKTEAKRPGSMALGSFEPRQKRAL